ncbi:MAG: transglycosylase domain-containing protein [Elusimicrobiota bacterium]|nr:transglycosylase domain-containing protein [Elusimicrobiota bacterium]
MADLPTIRILEDYTPSLSSKVYDKDENIIGEFFIEKRSIVPLKETPVNLQNAFIAIEDNDFYKHYGVSIRGITRAFLKGFLDMKLSEGGSTITQQLAKTIFLTRRKTIERKIKELFITLQIERSYSKDEILQFYMNQMYFGSGAYGVQKASKVYFNKNVGELNLAECAMLAAIPKSPNYYNPLKNSKAALKRRNLVLSRMKALNFITKQQAQEALKIPIPDGKTAYDQVQSTGHYFIEFLRIMLEQKYGSKVLLEGGLSIYTTLDMKSQFAAEETLETELAKFDVSRRSYFGKEEPVKAQGALIAIDTKNGAIRAMVGGRSFKESQFNRATQAKRQAGSSFKPFVYLAAIESGFTTSTIVDDSPMVFELKNKMWELVSRNVSALEDIAENVKEVDIIDTNKIWSPINYNKKFRGKVTLRTALALSINTCAVEILSKVSPDKVIEIAQRLGISTPLLRSPSLALGASDVTLQDMVCAYAVFASGGIKSRPYLISKIIDKNGRVLEQNSFNQQMVVSPQDSFIMTNMLKAAVEKGSGWKAKALGRPCAGKTGTTNDSSDAWFIGYTPQLAAGVWIGYDDISISLGEKSTGGVIACPIWTEFMKKALEGQPVLNFSQPEGIEWSLIDPKTGLLALSDTPGAFLDAFVKGTAPTEYSDQLFSFVDNADLSANEGF